MKSKMKYAVLVLVIGLLGLVILPSSVFAGLEYDIKIEGAISSNGTFETAGNKSGTRFNPFPKGKLPVEVILTFKLESLFLDDDFDDFRWSPLKEGDGLQELNNTVWRFHHIKITGNSLYCRFDLFYSYEGAWDHYLLDINMEFEKVDDIYTSVGEASINWTHYTYTENTKPRGKKKQIIEFQQLEHSSSGELIITITPR